MKRHEFTIKGLNFWLKDSVGKYNTKRYVLMKEYTDWAGKKVWYALVPVDTEYEAINWINKNLSYLM